MKKKNKLGMWLLLIVVGSSLIFWFDAVCEFARLKFGTTEVFWGTTLIVVISFLIFGNKILKFIKGQLGG